MCLVRVKGMNSQIWEGRVWRPQLHSSSAVRQVKEEFETERSLPILTETEVHMTGARSSIPGARQLGHTSDRMLRAHEQSVVTWNDEEWPSFKSAHETVYDFQKPEL